MLKNDPSKNRVDHGSDLRLSSATLVVTIFIFCFSPQVSAADVYLRIDLTTNKRAQISDLIYGSNDLPNENQENVNITSLRLGGNRWTTYNWENNLSNAGSDYHHSSDHYLLDGVQNEPAKAITSKFDAALSRSVAHMLVTVPAAGYVALTKDNEVRAGEGNKWATVKAKKGSRFKYPPDQTDGYVYVDEFVNFLTQKYRDNKNPQRGFSIDNEPALWDSTHSRMPFINSADMAKNRSASLIVKKSIETAAAIKAVAPAGEVFGPVAFGFWELLDNRGDKEFAGINRAKKYSWYLDYYIEQMVKGANEKQKQLIDVLDVHFYTSAKVGNEAVRPNEQSDVYEGSENAKKARVQAPRLLWDPNYTEDSSEVKYFRKHFPLIPAIKRSLETYGGKSKYKIQKIGFTEYGYAGRNHITGSIATADTLGIFGKQGVYIAHLFRNRGEFSDYDAAAFKIFRNFDGHNARFGNTSIASTTSNNTISSVYASIEGGNAGKLHIIVINKDFKQNMEAKINLAGTNRTYIPGEVWAYDENSSNITRRSNLKIAKGLRNNFSYSIPPLTVCHIVLNRVP